MLERDCQGHYFHLGKLGRGEDFPVSCKTQVQRRGTTEVIVPPFFSLLTEWVSPNTHSPAAGPVHKDLAGVAPLQVRGLLVHYPSVLAVVCCSLVLSWYLGRMEREGEPGDEGNKTEVPSEENTAESVCVLRELRVPHRERMLDVSLHQMRSTGR